MTLSPPPRAEVYLVENRLNPISTRAALELTDDNLRCTVKEYSKWVEKALGISDLRSRLQAGEAVAAFDFRRDQLKIKWLKQFLKAGFSVSEGSSRRWLVSLVYPTGILALVEVVDGWMHSPGHRENILRDAFTQMGVWVKMGVPGEPAASLQGATCAVSFSGPPLPAEAR